MRKLFSYIVLGLAVIGFAYNWIRTGSATTALVIVGIGLAWFLFENFFEIISLFGRKTDDNSNIKKTKEDLKKVTDNNPTLR